MTPHAGLIGIYRSPKLRSQISSVYMIADDTTQSLFIYALFPGFYDDAYEVAFNVWYRNVFIIPVSLDGMYISDVARLANDLVKQKPVVRIIYPGRFSAFVPTDVQKCLIKTDRKSYSTYYYGFQAFNYQFDNAPASYQQNFYDIYVTYKKRRMLFCPFEVNKERILYMLKNDKVDWVYVPYSDPMFGADSFATILLDDDFKDYMKHIIAFGFMNETQALYCKGRYPDNFPNTIRNAFITSSADATSSIPPVTGGDVVYVDETTRFSDDDTEIIPSDVTKPPYPKPIPTIPFTMTPMGNPPFSVIPEGPIEL
jgi:hypothetical protein